MRLLVTLTVTVLVASMFMCLRGLADDGIDPNAVLAKMHEVYAKAKSYQDTGVVETIMDFGDRKQTMTKRFSIAFKRPSSIKIEWIDIMMGGQETRSVLWSDGKVTQTFWEQLNQVQTSNSLRMAIAGATGVSGGAAHTVPSMLLRELKMPTLSGLTEVKLLREEAVEDVPCYVIVGRHPAGFEYTLWIGKNDYLLRRSEYVVKSHKDLFRKAEAEMGKVKEEHKIQMPDTSMMRDFSSVNREMHRGIQVNHEIPDGVITFTPPENVKHVTLFRVGD